MNIDSLKKELECDISTDKTTLLLYASDASIYQQLPRAVAFPKSTNDCRVLLQAASALGIAVIPRAGGTSLAGQVVGNHLIIDTSRYLNRIIAIDYQNLTAQVQPGVIPAVLNQQLAQHSNQQRLMFAPDPSTLDRCNIAGMIGNNAWGAHCPSYGTTREHILSLEALLANGDPINCSALTQAQFRQKQVGNNAEAHIYQTLDQIISQYRQVIIDAYPPIEELPCNAGYALHTLCQMQPWNTKGTAFNLASLICGSEGTLGLVTEATVRLTPCPTARVMICAHFDSLEKALFAVTVARTHGANAVELLDQFLLRLSRDHINQQSNRAWVIGDPAAVLLIEFTGMEENETMQRCQYCIEALQREKLALHYPLLKHAETQRAWNLRRASLGFLMGVTSIRKPVTFIEDSAVPIQHLPSFVADIQQLMQQHQLQCVYYGSVSMGLIHLRPLLDLQSDKDITLFTQILEAVTGILKKYHGTLTAKHGDGIVRSPYIRTMLGEQVWQSHTEIKQAFDPNNLLNPNKITNPLPITKHLRIQEQVVSERDQPFFTWQVDGGIKRSIYKCNGAGVCRKLSSGSTMCPSYRATGNEIDSTRGRANIYRQVIQEFGFNQGIIHPALASALEHCLSCKACKTECPANVDMAKIKSEQRYQWIKKHGKSQTDVLIKYFEAFSWLASRLPGVSNTLARNRFAKSLAGLHPQRNFPALAPTTLSHWFKRNRPHANAEQLGQVLFLSDPFTHYYDVDAGIAAIEVLERIGFRVLLSPVLPSLRTVISQGLLDEARKRLIQNANVLLAYVAKGIPIVGIEPSEVLTYRDEIRDINISREFNAKVYKLGEQVLLFDEFIQLHRQQINDLSLQWSIDQSDIYVHGHCHQKAMIGMEPTLATLSLIENSRTHTIPSGCCGMAGFFGYQARHYELSNQIAELELFPSIRQAANAIVVATGTSCRQQIHSGLQQRSYHTAEVLRLALPS